MDNLTVLKERSLKNSLLSLLFQQTLVSGLYYERSHFTCLYRFVVKFEGVVYVLHAFQKKSKRGIATPKQDIELIEARLKRAKEHYEQYYKQRLEEDKNEQRN
ncbi:type II toxin-antitoxin system RelE/ParE family toxin [Fischerella sp.]|jgi:phage-related protein|uniref:type II toxin-antitoxin system RelE/ParE family toxin n=1 Tax=Fischerella sp. TaxID=1191 RepID=UPI0025C60013|nr:type II toxin-antitoxin system RelE/ParE family toxin [Fischerella sp.]